MKKIFFIDGGAGRAICAIPALEKYIRNNPQDEISIIIPGWDNLFWGNKLLQDITFSDATKGIFDLVVKKADKIFSPEPYRVPGYFNQKLSLAQAFDEEINNTDDHSDLSIPKLYVNKVEEKGSLNLIADVKSQFQKSKTVVFQPYGRSARLDRNEIIDDSSRGLDSYSYLKLVKKLSSKYNVILFAEQHLYSQEDSYTFKPQIDLRNWFGIIQNCDYFIGCDSVGQHIARCFNKPGTVLIGSTFPVNVSYPDFFNIIEKKEQKKYSPIRICSLDSHLADRYNDNCMNYSDNEIDSIFKNIVSDIEKKVK